MTRTTACECVRTGLQSFRRAERGNVAIFFAVMVIPIMGFVGAAVDYSRANSIKSAMQSAIDATALMLSKEITSLDSTQISEKATNYFKALFNRPEASGITITPTYTTSGGTQLVISGSANVATTVMKAMGVQALNVNVSSTVKWGNTRLRVALALDNTGSMADAGKITALKTATKNLLTSLQSAAVVNGDVYVSIVPFSRDVNVGDLNYNANWIDWTAWDAANGSMQMVSIPTKSDFADAGAFPGWSASYQWPLPEDLVVQVYNGNGNGNGGKTLKWVPNSHDTWNGCITDRGDATGPSAQNYDTNVSLPVLNVTASQFPAEQYDACPTEMVGLTYNWTKLNQTVDAMTPNGNTNQAIGLAWGWQSLIGGGPLAAPAKDANYKYNDVIILLTDGLNTENRWYSDQNSIDAREKLTCANIKAAGVTIYTVQVNTAGDPTSQLLKDCASDANKFFLLTSANSIVTTFNSIGTQLSSLRVTK